MSCRDILVHVDSTETPALAAATDFARRQDARLVGLGVHPQVWTGFGLHRLPATAIEALERANKEAIAEAKRRFDRNIERYGYADRAERRSSQGDLVAVVVWNGSREAARAVADAFPLLQRARQVDVVAIAPPKVDQIPGIDIARHLAGHDVRANVVAREGIDLDAAREILNCIADRGADLLVMGCYGQARLHEMIFGCQLGAAG
ncbi:universal stress protein [Inquilinus sp. OTU3971]|uniref:universal stress protein n=1 Tax=Inquilinus sp. OTU3971 TaxID=3043855 RepID=UPI00313B5153